VALLKFYAKPTTLQADAQPFVREFIKMISIIILA
jgi:hypothetical protein